MPKGVKLAEGMRKNLLQCIFGLVVVRPQQNTKVPKDAGGKLTIQGLKRTFLSKQASLEQPAQLWPVVLPFRAVSHVCACRHVPQV